MALATGLVVIGVRTVRRELIETTDAWLFVGWTLGGAVLFFGVGVLLFVLETTTGESIPYSTTMTITVTALGGFVGAVVGLYDGNRRAQARTLRERKRRLDAKTDRLEDLASIVSHDLRNPLNVAQGRLELAREDDAEKHLVAVDRSLDRMETLIDDLVTMARKDERVEDPEPIAIGDAVGTAWKHVATESATLECPAEGRILADGSRLSELLENLFDNAVTHAGSDVTVTVEDIDGGFAIADDGPGIPPEERSTVLEAGHSTDPDGTGFGLYIVRLIADAHEWSVRVTESRTGGARFEFTGVELVPNEPDAEEGRAGGRDGAREHRQTRDGEESSRNGARDGDRSVTVVSGRDS